MRKPVMPAVFAVAAILLLTDIASAQLLFPRIRQQRQAQQREIVRQQVYSQLQTDLTRQMGSVEQSLQTSNQKQVLEQAGKLEAQLAARMSEMEKQAEQLLANHKRKLSQLVEKQIGDMQKEAEAQIASESKRLQQLVSTNSNNLNANIEKRLASATSTLETRFADQSKRMDAAIKKANAKLMADNKKQSQQLEMQLKQTQSNLQDRLVSQTKQMNEQILEQAKANIELRNQVQDQLKKYEAIVAKNVQLQADVKRQLELLPQTVAIEVKSRNAELKQEVITTLQETFAVNKQAQDSQPESDSTDADNGTKEQADESQDDE